MSDAMKPLRSYQPFLDLMIQMENPVIGILIALHLPAKARRQVQNPVLATECGFDSRLRYKAGSALKLGLFTFGPH